MPPSPDMIVNLAGMAKIHSDPNVRQASVEALANRASQAQEEESAILVQELKKASRHPVLAVSSCAKAALEDPGISERASSSKTK